MVIAIIMVAKEEFRLSRREERGGWVDKQAQDFHPELQVKMLCT